MRIGGLAGDLGIRYFRPPEKRLQLALQPFRLLPWAVLSGALLGLG